MKDLYVVNCCRTAIGSFGGSLKNTPATEMGAIVVKEALKRANVAPENVDELMFGCILTAGLGQNVARQVSVKAGIPYSVPAYTIGMVCGSGMKSVIEGARAILSGDANIVVCGGTENMSAAPFASPDARWGARMGDKKIVDTMIRDGLWDAFNNYHMGTTAENINDIWGITRREQDEFAAASQQKTEAAQAAGRFDDEIVPVPVKVKKEIVEFKRDEFPKAGVTADGIAKADGPFQALKETLDALPDETMKKRVRHVVTEIERVRSFVRAFANGDIEAAGRLFNASHDSLAADYEVTVPELDVAVDVARKNGAYGARMTGGGFGGSIIALVDKGRSQEVAQKIADEFEKQGFHAPRALAAYAAKSASREA